MPNRNHRPQKNEDLIAEADKPVLVKPLEQLDRMHNPKDIEPDVQAMAAGMEHGGTIESRAEALSTRGSGGRKRSGNFGRYHSGRDVSKKR